MTKQELIERHRVEEEMLISMLPFYSEDEETLNLLLDRLNAIKKLIETWEKEIDNEEKNPL
jgi:hypothetical protein